MAGWRLLDPLVAAAVVVAIVLPLVLPSYAMATEVVIFILAALGSNLLIGYVGLFSFAQGVFFGIGAYACGLTLIHMDWGLWASLLSALLLSAAAGLVVAVLGTQRRGIYFIMLTLALAQMFYFIAYALADLTGGDNGLLDVPRPPLTAFGRTLVPLATPASFYALVAVFFVLLFAFLQRLVASPFGSTLIAIRENEARAVALGYNTRVFKVAAIVVSGAVTGLAGGLYALFLNFVPLSNIDVSMSERIVIMTIVGGAGSLFGAVLGASFYTILGDVLSASWPRWLLIVGVILMVVAAYPQGGIWGGLAWLTRQCRRSG